MGQILGRLVGEYWKVLSVLLFVADTIVGYAIFQEAYGYAGMEEYRLLAGR